VYSGLTVISAFAAGGRQVSPIVASDDNRESTPLGATARAKRSGSDSSWLPHAQGAIFAHLFALAPGILGDYLRIAFYKLTLSYCILGRTKIGAKTQIASGVQILSGSHQHIRYGNGRISGAEQGVFAPVVVGADCWIGASAIVMADVGDGSTIGAGSVVSRPIPPGSVAVGRPARVINAGDADI